jgi:acyl-CoA reductase-like NAD-dependent aldehyde dehydrogenase
MSEYKLLINGELVDGAGESVDVINPATEAPVSTLSVASESQLLEAVAAAKAAFPKWCAMPAGQRKELLDAAVQRINDNSEDIAKLIVAEQGKTLEFAKVEVMLSEMFAGYFAGQELGEELVADDDAQHAVSIRKPLGVVACIMPWNFPFVQALYKMAPALAAGNTVVLKPSPYTPLSTLKLGELVADLFPPGVVNIIADNNDLGAALTSHPDVAMVSFTGSTPTGKAIMASAAGSMKRVTLECGGNDAGIVLDDADPKAIADGVFGGAFMNSGQVCVALKRLYVHESLYDDLCAELAERAANAVVGDGMDPETQFGPVQNKAQFDKVVSYIEDAQANGTIIAGGEVPDRTGYFLPLTVVRDIEDGTRVVDEEPFGPILPVLKYSDLDDAISRANASPFGLGGSVWSSNAERAREVAARLECGTAWINQHPAFAPNVPFPASKESGIGVEWGPDALHEYTSMQVINAVKG